jgi:hypothetical protein
MGTLTFTVIKVDVPDPRVRLCLEPRFVETQYFASPADKFHFIKS